MDQEQFRLIACPHLLASSRDRLDVYRPVGGSVTDFIRSIGWTSEGLSARVFLDGEFVREAAWEYTRPRAGQSLVLRAIPTGGGNGKSALRIVEMISVITAAAFVPGAIGLVGVAAALTTASISIVGSLALSGPIPAPLPRRRDDHGRKTPAC